MPLHYSKQYKPMSVRARKMPTSKYTRPLPSKARLAAAPQARSFVKGGPKAPKLEQK